jgi:hypothetical protein
LNRMDDRDKPGHDDFSVCLAEFGGCLAGISPLRPRLDRLLHRRRGPRAELDFDP